MDTTTDTATPLVEAREAPDTVPNDLSEIFPKLAPKPIEARRLDQAKAFVKRFWAPPNEAAMDLIMLWAQACHFTGEDQRLLWLAFPRLFIGSKGRGSGKSTLLKLLAGRLNGESDGLCPRGEWVSNPSGPSLRGLLHGCQATIMFDQADTAQGSGTFPEETKNVLLQGYDQGGTVTRGGNSATGEIKRLRIDGPICLGGLYGPFTSHPNMDDVRSRTLLVRVTKRPDGTELAPLDWMIMAGELKGHHDAFAATAETIKHKATRLRPDLTEYKDRDRQLVLPIVATGAAISPDWERRARNACHVILRGGVDEETPPEPKNAFETLMRDLGLVWRPDEERLFTRDLVDRLRALPNSSWAQLGEPQDAGRKIVQLLRPEGVEPRTFRVPGGEPGKGYLLRDLVEYCDLKIATVPDPDEDPFG